MLVATIIMGVFAIALFLIGYFKGEGQHITGLREARNLFIEILPLLMFAMVVAGMSQVLLRGESLSRLIGEESGLRGIMIGTVAGVLTPGGPIISLSIVAGLFRAGAGLGTLVAFVTGWSLFGISRLPIEVGLLGWKFAAVRIVSTFFFPPLAGFIVHILFSSPK